MSRLCFLVASLLLGSNFGYLINRLSGLLLSLFPACLVPGSATYKCSGTWVLFVEVLAVFNDPG